MKNYYKNQVQTKPNQTVEPQQDLVIDNLITMIQNLDDSKWEHFMTDEVLKNFVAHNPFSNTVYSGINEIMLLMAKWALGFKSNRYATFKQIKEAGGFVKKGAKSISIEFWNFFYVHDKTREKISHKEWTLLSAEKQEEYHKRRYVKCYRVFNLEQTEGIDESEFPALQLEFEPIEQMEEFYIQTVVEKQIIIDYQNTDSAFYSPKYDTITLPNRELFRSSQVFYATAWHEIVHWTGSEKRLDRKTFGMYGSTSYSFEELVAEMGSMFIMCEHKLFDEFKNSLVYLKGWLASTESEDPAATLRDAFIKAQQAINFLKA